MGARSEIGIQRLGAQRVMADAFHDAGEVAAWLGAIQGQDYAGTKWAFGLRIGAVTDAGLEQALADGVVFRTWALRGTLHYVAPKDIHWLLALIGPRLIAGNARRYRELGLDEATLSQSVTIIVEALQDAGHLTRGDLFNRLEAKGISAAGQRGVYMLQRAALERQVYQGPVRRNETTFLLLPPGSTLPKEDALGELARRYFISHGPATLNDFTAWSGLLISEARQGLNAIESELVREVIAEQTYFRSPETYNPPHSLYLLPGFDEFVLGYRDRSAVLDPQNAEAICPGGNGMFMSTIVSEGRIIGTWKRTLKKTSVDVSLLPFRPFTLAEMDAIREQAEQYAAFLGLELKLIDPAQ